MKKEKRKEKPKSQDLVKLIFALSEKMKLSNSKKNKK